MKNKSKVLLATSIGPGKEYAVPIVQDTATWIEGADDTLLVADGVEVGTVVDAVMYLAESEEKLNRIARIARVRARTRMHFLGAGDWTHLFFLDADVVPPANIIPRLLAAKAPIATGIYPLRDFSAVFMPAVTMGASGKRIVGAVHITTKAQAFGMGCMLIERDVLQRTEFRSGEALKELGEDYGFCIDSGEDVTVDPSVSCWHVHSDGTAGRLAVEEVRYGVMWEGSSMYGQNKFGSWVLGEPKYDLSQDKIDQLGPEFSVGQFTPVKVESRAYADLLSEGQLR